ncbi:MAG: histidinol-phosphate transaminase [Clostridia bacterium]|nr:histidinol-phosphate transaminase [Clostridia bacterium]
MSRYFTDKYSLLVPYVPGEQPKDMQYIKLNTNESPFPPSEYVKYAVEKEYIKLNLYSDPECSELRQKMSEIFGLKEEQIIMTNGSDEVLNFAFMAFADEKRPLAFPDITYGFYPVFANLNHIPYEEIPLADDFSINPDDYINVGKTVVIANPNAPTGIALPLRDIEKIVKSNPGNVVIIDEAYIDFGGESALKLVNKYDNLLVTGTFSKSRSMAGARLGFGFANEKLISDLNTIKYSTNPYNVNRLTAAAGIAALKDNSYYMDNCKKIINTRKWTTEELEKLGFKVIPSSANFVFAKSDVVNGETLYRELKKHGVLIRHFSNSRICDYNRITIGTMEQMELFISKTKKILEGFPYEKK